MSEFLEDLRMEKLAIPQWDAPATIAEAAEYVLEKTVLQMNASYPAYVTIGYDWEEIILYDWPNDLRGVGKEEEQDQRLTRMIERFQQLIAQ